MGDHRVRHSADEFNILVATDNHLGYEEDNPVIGKDSFRSFEEILKIAQERDVDFILLGGDLFHYNNPSIYSYHKCLSLLRKYCMGDKPISVEILSDQGDIFKHCSVPTVNYEDPNLNISIPVFSIHGNHDDPSGFGCLSAMDILADTGLVNYFGKVTTLNEVRLVPLLLKKGKTNLAIYGLSHLRDERLARLFLDKKVEFVRPQDNPESWCSILVIHQNRADRGAKKFIEEKMLPDFLELVIWGHEHDCRVSPEYNATKGFRVIQPGSSVATSLCEGEALPKHIAIVKVHQQELFVEPIPLETVRPFVFDTVVLSKASLNSKAHKLSVAVQDYLSEKIESMLERAMSLHSGHPDQPLIPLIRLRVEYSNENEFFNAIRFGHEYNDKVANPGNMVKLCLEHKKSRLKKGDGFDKDAMDSAWADTEDNDDMTTGSVDRESLGSKVEKVVERYFEDTANNKPLVVLSVKGLNEAISRIIAKGDNNALADIIMHQKKKSVEYMQKCENFASDGSNFDDCIKQFRQLRTAEPDKEAKEVSGFLDGDDRHRSSLQSSGGLDSDSDMDEPMHVEPEVAPRGRGRGRGRGSRARATTARGTTRGATTARGTRGRANSTITSPPSRVRARTSQTSIADMFQSQVPVSPPAKKKKIGFQFGDDSD